MCARLGWWLWESKPTCSLLSWRLQAPYVQVSESANWQCEYNEIKKVHSAGKQRGRELLSCGEDWRYWVRECFESNSRLSLTLRNVWSSLVSTLVVKDLESKSLGDRGKSVRRETALFRESGDRSLHFICVWPWEVSSSRASSCPFVKYGIADKIFKS